ncbi:MAG TPA: lysine--tRNA ligase [bacterium]|nr:lysine--tRNA ligase [bacterium]HNS48541.1 lysine--tRNA ligase [bacterium]
MAEEDILAERRKKLAGLLERGVEAYGRRYDRTNPIAAVTESSERVLICGRLMAWRDHGKAAFADLEDFSGRIQLYFQRDRLGDDFSRVKDLDIGDFVGVAGRPFRTRTGMLTIGVEEFTLLSKSLRPLPEKWHGLKDVEIRYRQRYLDLLANPDTRKVFATRSRIIAGIRRQLDQLGFLEVETPMMHPIPGGAEARPFVTHHNALELELYLRIAPELYLKRLLVGGLERVYEINRSFRNEGISTLHNPEFTMLELYAAYGDYRLMAELAELLILNAIDELFPDSGRRLSYQGREIDFTPPWPRLTLAELLRERLDLPGWDDRSLLLERARAGGLELDGSETVFDLLDLLFKFRIQPGLVRPTFVLDYPAEISPLAKSKPGQPGVVERFELFIGGLEVGNAYSELNDPIDQERRFQAEVRTGRPDRPKVVDEDYIEALSYGMPPAGGLGIGLDRLVMILVDTASIRDVILFPILRPVR